MIKSLFTIISCCSVLYAAASVIETTPGNLSNLLKNCDLDNSLILKGEADARDFEALRNLPESVSTIDLSDLKIAAYYSETPFLANYSFAEQNALPPYAFFMSKAQTVTLPSNLTSIGEGAFSNSSVSNVEIPQGVSQLGDYAFFNAANIKNIILPELVVNIGSRCFEKCGNLSSITLSKTLIKVIPDHCFAFCKNLKAIELPVNCARIGDEAFACSGLTSFTSADVLEFGSFTFADCKDLASVTLNPDASFGDGLLMNCSSLKEINGTPPSLPALFAPNCPGIVVDEFINNAACIGDFAFANNNVSSIILSENLQFIGDAAFADIEGIREINAVALKSNIPVTDENAFQGVNTSTISLIVARNSVDLWSNHPVWKNFQISAYTLGIDTPAADSNDININLSGEEIIASASAEIRNVAIYSVNGTLLVNSSPQSEQCRININDFSHSGGIIIVCVKTDTAYKASKIIL